jgi:2-amino-4-hydroxy-6-hydroxymethyldihydropteridine diphosphokinase
LNGQQLERAYISIGSNIDPEHYLALAILRLKALGRIKDISSVYESLAYLPEGHPLEGEISNFFNVAVLLETNQEPAELKQSLLIIEQDLGRVRTEDKYAPRTIDLDLSLFETKIVDDTELILPDPDILEHAHLAIPLAQLDSTFVHPQSGEELRVIADRLLAGADLIQKPELTHLLTEMAIDR